MGDTTLRSNVKAGKMKIDDVCLFSHVSCEVQCERQVHYEKNVGAEAKAAQSERAAKKERSDHYINLSYQTLAILAR